MSNVIRPKSLAIVCWRSCEIKIDMIKKISFFPVILILAGVFLVFLHAADSVESFQRNLHSLATYETLVAEKADSELNEKLSSPQTSDWERKVWFLALMADHLEDDEVAEDYLKQYLINGGPEALSLAHSTFPEDIGLAQFAVDSNPDQAEAWSWLGDRFRIQGDNENALQSYQNSVVADTAHWQSWCWIGFLKRETDLQAAQQAYRSCCRFGDNSANGCYHAGWVSEQLGDYSSALEFYSLSDPEATARLILEHPELQSNYPER